MNNMNILTIINQNNHELLSNLIEKEGKIAVLSAFANVLDKRAYVTIDTDGELKRKEGSITLPFFAYNDNAQELAKNILKCVDLKEKQNFDKIERFSNLDIEKVKKNLIKTIMNGNLDFAKKYGKELFLRDRKEFFNLVATFVTIGNSDSLKGLFLLGLEKLISEFDNNIFTLFISYITKYRDNTAIYECCEASNLTTKELKELLLKDETLLNSKLGLGIITNLYILDNFKVNNKDKVINKLAFEIKNHCHLKPLSNEEKQILAMFL